MSLLIDMSEMPPGVVDEFRKGRVAKEVVTLAQAPTLQNYAARAVHAVEHKAMDGLGRLRMVVTPDAFHYWGRRLGYACWNDRQFINEFERDNPAVRVKSGGTRVQVGYEPGAALKTKFPPKGIVPAGKYSNLTQTC